MQEKIKEAQIWGKIHAIIGISREIDPHRACQRPAVCLHHFLIDVKASGEVVHTPVALRFGALGKHRWPHLLPHSRE